MDDINLIKTFLKSYIKPQKPQVLKGTYIAYRFSTYFVEKYHDQINNHILKLIKIFVEICKLYCLENSISDHNEYILNILTTEDKSRNTGSIGKNIKFLKEILDQTGEPANIRELFCIIDEIIHNGCEVISWLLFVKYCSDSLPENIVGELNSKCIYKKLIFIAETITGGKQNFFNNQVELKKYIYELLGTKYPVYKGKHPYLNNDYPWKAKGFPSVCHLWGTQERTYSTHKLLFNIEFQRSSNETGIYKWWDTMGYNAPTICKYPEANNIAFISDDITMPKLTSRELNHAKSLNKNFDEDHVVPWKGGCCYYHTTTDTITYKISEMYNKARTTSYSGHTVMDLEFLSLFKDFDDWKEVYILCIIATMLPYCHHTDHEILTVSTYWDIDYDITKDQKSNLIYLIEKLYKKNILNFDLEIDKINNFDKESEMLFGGYKKYRLTNV